MQADRPDLRSEALERTRELMNRAVPDCLVAGYEHLIEGLDLPDPDDRHVLAAAIRAHAQAVVTFNLKDFPDHVLARYDMEPKHPDEFVLDSIDLAPGAIVQCNRAGGGASPSASVAARATGHPVAVAALAAIARLTGVGLPSARRCLRVRPAALPDEAP